MTSEHASITGKRASAQGEAVIREAQPGDAEAWARLRAELWPDCSVERHRLEIAQLSRSAGVVALAMRAGEPIGFAEVSIRADHVEGTSSTPVPYLEGWYVARGYREMACDAEIDNEASILLHGRRGFAEVGRTVHFFKTL